MSTSNIALVEGDNCYLLAAWGSWRNFGHMIRPCVDCGRRTGSFCDAGDVVAGVCRLALPWPSATPLCTACDAKHGKCHLCRRVPWVAQPPWG